jgi:hypothetical protein
MVYHTEEVRWTKSIREKGTAENTLIGEEQNVTGFEKKYGMILKSRFSKIDQYANVISVCVCVCVCVCARARVCV